jgi:hypothetical protein
MSNHRFTTGQSLVCEIVDVVDAQGQEAVLTEAPVWSSSDEEILTLTASTDGMTARGVAQKKGTVMISAKSGDVEATTAILVGPGDVVSFSISVGVAGPPVNPAPIPPPEPVRPRHA